MGTPKVGNDVLKEVISALAAGARAGVALSDGFQLGDIAEFVQLAKALPPVIRDRALIVPQYADLDDAEQADLTAFVSTAITLPPQAKDVQDFLVKALGVVVALSAFVRLFHPTAA